MFTVINLNNGRRHELGRYEPDAVALTLYIRMAIAIIGHLVYVSIELDADD